MSWYTDAISIRTSYLQVIRLITSFDIYRYSLVNEQQCEKQNQL